MITSPTETTYGPFRRAPHSRSKMGGVQKDMLQEITTTTGIVKENLVRKIPQKMEPFNQKAFTKKIYKLELVPMSKLKYVHPLVLRLFQNHSIEDFPLAGRLKNFRKNWEKVTNNPEILRIVSGLKIDFLEEPLQTKPPHQARMSREEASLIEEEVKATLEKGAVQKAKEMKGQFLRNLFLVSQKGRWN